MTANCKVCGNGKQHAADLVCQECYGIACRAANKNELTYREVVTLVESGINRPSDFAVRQDVLFCGGSQLTYVRR